MPATATQLPFTDDKAARTGRRLFRKQVLPSGEVEHPQQGRLSFDLAGLVDRFKAGAMDQVPFLIAGDDRDHPASGGDPERFRGEIKGLELANDGLYATIETTDRGAELLGEDPKLPVSVRVKQAEGGRFKGKEVLAHVVATMDPVATGMRPWEPIDASNDVELVDLSDGGAYRSAISTDADTKGTDALTDDEQGALRKLLSKVTGGGKSDDPAREGKSDTPSTDDTDKTDDEPVLSDDQFEKLLKDFDLDSAEEPKPADEEKEPAAASLSDEDRNTLDMANTRIRKSDLRAGKAELSNRFKTYLDAGVPPAMIEAAREKLEGDDDLVVDFANDKTSVALDATFAALDAAKGTIDFSERGSSLGDDAEDDEKAKERRETAEAAAKGWA